MKDKEEDALVLKPSGAVEKAVPGVKQILSRMVSDALALAEQRAPGPARFRIGDYDWCEPDYRQILIWAEGTGLKPEEVIDRLFDQQSLRKWRYEGELLHNQFFEEPLFEDGRILKANLDLRLLRCGSLEWAKGLEITCLRLIGASDETIDLGLLPLPRLTTLSCVQLGLTRLYLTRVPQLEHLDCTENRLKELQLDRVPRLVGLHCRKNELAELKFDRTPNLHRLNCWSNKLTQLDLSGLNRLRMLLCGVYGLPIHEPKGG